MHVTIDQSNDGRVGIGLRRMNQWRVVSKLKAKNADSHRSDFA